MSGVSGESARRVSDSAAERARTRGRRLAAFMAATVLLGCGRETVDFFPGTGGSSHAGEPGTAGFRPGVEEPNSRPGTGAESGDGGSTPGPPGGGFGGTLGGTGGGYGVTYGCRTTPGRCEAIGQVCDPINDRCIRGCAGDADCRRGTCQGGQCIECWSDPECGITAHCVVNTCVECVMPGECPPDRPVCDYRLFCRPCSHDNECAPGQSCGYGRCM